MALGVQIEIRGHKAALLFRRLDPLARQRQKLIARRAFVGARWPCVSAANTLLPAKPLAEREWDEFRSIGLSQQGQVNNLIVF